MIFVRLFTIFVSPHKALIKNNKDLPSRKSTYWSLSLATFISLDHF